MKRRTFRRPRRTGFTLLEVMLVLAILVILGGFVAFNLLGTSEKAYKKAAMQQLHGIEGMLDLYYLDMQSYPPDLSALRVAPSDAANAQKWDGPYAKKDIPADPWGQAYQYEVNGSSYKLYSAGPNGAAGDDDDVVLASST